MGNVEIQYRIANLREKRFFIQEASSLTIETLRAETAYKINLDSSLERDTNHVVITFDMRLSPKDRSETTLLHYVASMSYEVHGFEMMLEGMEKPSIPTIVMQSLISATYSTFRGIIYARCGGSLLREAILPLADPRLFINQEEIITGPLIAKDLPAE